VIGAIAIAIGALFVSGHFGLPYIPMIAPNPAISGYIGFYAGMIALAIIPLIILIRLAIRFIWGYRSSYRFRRAMAGVWVVSFVIFIMTVAFTARNFVYQSSATDDISEMLLDSNKVLDININELGFNRNAKIQFGNSFLSNGRLFIRDGVHVEFVPSDNESVGITKTAKSLGMNDKYARRNIYYPEHEIELSDNKLSIDNYYSLSKRDKFRAQELYYVVAVPEGTQLNFEGWSNIFMDRELRRNKGTKEWVMTKEGLSPVSDS